MMIPLAKLFESQSLSKRLPVGHFILALPFIMHSSAAIAHSHAGISQDSITKSTLSTVATTNTTNYINLANSAEKTDIDIPDLGSGGGRFLEANQYKALGEWSIRQLNRSVPKLNDPWSQEVIEAMVWQINANARTSAPLGLVIIKNPTINAFAIPGGVMGLHTGTVNAANSMDELASVMAHEVAHLSQRHYEHRAGADKKAFLIQLGGLLAGIAASAADGDAAAAIIMGSQTAALNSQMSFSRSNEREADRIGMQLMAKSGYDPRAMPRFFATLNQKSELNSSQQSYLPSFIMTHPLTAERLSEAQSRANSYEPTNSLVLQKHQMQFDLLKWRIKVLTKETNEPELLASAFTNYGAALALAYWYGLEGRYTDAQTVFERLHQVANVHRPNLELLLAITEAQVAGMQRQWDKAERILLPFYNVYPERRDLTLYLSDIWLHQGKYTDALGLLKILETHYPHDTDVLSMIQHTYELMAREDSQTNSAVKNVATINALRYRAQVELWHAHYNDALISLQQAKKLAEKGATSANTHSLLALISKEVDDVKTARDFSP